MTALLAGLTALTLTLLYRLTVEEIGTTLWGTHGQFQVTATEPQENGDGEPGSHGTTLSGDFTSDSGDEHFTGIKVGISLDEEHQVGDTLQVRLWTPVADSAYEHPGILHPLLRAPLSQAVALPVLFMGWVVRSSWVTFNAEEAAAARARKADSP
ncbi:hypothetical protein [Kitasatospora kazusensis]